MMTTVKKSYASLQSVQEGNIVPENRRLDTKGIEILTKSSKSIYTREALKKILLEDIMKAPVIDQLAFIKHIRILEKSIYNDVMSGSKKYYKPNVIKSANAYNDPIHIQGIKGAIAFNTIKPADTQGINLEERNAIDIARVQINHTTIEKIKDKYPEVYQNCLKLLEMPEFKDGADAVSIPTDIPYTPDWLREFINIDEILNDNISGFPFESVGIKRFDKGTINYTNIVEL